MARGTAAVAGGQLAWSVEGEGPALVLLHGGLLDSRMWDELVPRLRRAHRVVGYDLRGHGASSTPAGPYAHHEDLRALLDQLGVARAALVGLSLGALVAVDFALDNPDRVDALVLASPSLSGWELHDPVLLARLREMAMAGAAGDGQRLVEWFLRAWVDGPSRTPQEVDVELRQRVQAMVVENLAAHRSAAGTARDVGAVHRVGELDLPVLAVVGELDAVDAGETADLLVGSVPGAQSFVVPGSGHLVPLERPARFTEALAEFLPGRPDRP